MPELPEVETTRRGLAPSVVGRTIASVSVYDRRLRWPVPRDLRRRLAGRRIDAVDRRGKYLLFRIAGDTLIVHLGMTGSLRIHGRAPAREAHDHVDIVLDEGSTLRYHDPRRFGAVLWTRGDALGHPLLAGLGPEPFDAGFDADALYRATRGRRQAIKQALMDNRLVVGVGNIYASESLHRAGIRPTRPAGRLTRAQARTLVDQVRATLEAALSRGGTTFRDYVDSRGEPGGFQQDCAVYGREGLPCPGCGAPVRAIRMGGRSTYYCPRCQR